MMKNGLKIIDSDMHIQEPPDIWENYVDAPFKQHAPRVVKVPSSGDFNLHLVNGREARHKSPSLAADARMIGGRRNESPDAVDFARKQGFNPKSQLEAMDIEGLDVAVLFPTACLHIMTIPDMDPLLAEAICRAYNNWLYDFCQEDPARMKGAALLPPHDVSLAVREARRAVKELGFVSAFLRATPLPGDTWFSLYWEPLWAELEDLGAPVGFHECTNSGHYPHIERFGRSNRLMRHICSHVTGQMVTMVDIILGGVLERFPGLKVAFLECNCGWTPSWLSRMDTHWEQLGAADAPMLTMKPSEYFMRQCVVGCEGEEREVGSV
ncbi:MAG: amidohydrolase family protein, partial [Deltaproteobacteria bacterium]|nr:amidohydrolase family protein [Deltaproteobacteria bacterium]